MSQRGITELIAAMENDTAVADTLEQATSAQQFIDIAAEHGFEIAPADLAGVIDSIPLSDAQLELISGGNGYDALNTA